MQKQIKSYGYYSIVLSLEGARKLMQTNNERAFVVSQLQDLLSPRLLISAVPAHKQLASCVDLLAFSLRGESIQLLVFAIDSSVVSQLTNHIAARLRQYQYEYQPRVGSPEIITSIKKLRGPHQALARSIEIHSLHEDWEYDRYSSIGFYLHDRRGDWMRIWRLTRLYDNVASNYYQLIEKNASKSTRSSRARLQSFAA